MPFNILTKAVAEEGLESRQPFIIGGDKYTDDRGTLSFVNDFDLGGIKRFYLIEHSNVDIVRAWQGHQVESKWFYVVEGSFLIAWVKIDNWENPNSSLQASYKILSARKSEILAVPAGFANGFKALTQGAKLIIFSNLTLEASAKDMYRFESSRWFDWFPDSLISLR